MAKPDFAQRQSRTHAVMAEFRQHPGEWIGVHRLAHVGGFAAWRSRVSEARVEFEADKAFPQTIEWNNDRIESAYRLRPVPQGRDSTVLPKPDPAESWRQRRLVGM